MKQLLSAICAVIMVIVLAAALSEGLTADPEPLSARVKISVSCSHGSYNNVGTDWSSYFRANKKQIKGSAVLTLTEGRELSLYAQFKENDQNPDLGYHTETLTIDRELLENGAELTFRIEVYENGGRYKGSCCVWTAVFTLEHIEWTDTPLGTEAEVTADTVAFTAEDGKIIYLKKGAVLMVMDYHADTDRFSAEYNGVTGYVKGIGLDYSKEELKALSQEQAPEAALKGVEVKVTADTVALTALSGKVTYLKKGTVFTVTGYSADADRFTAVYNGTEGSIKGIGLSCTKEQLKAMLEED